MNWDFFGGQGPPFLWERKGTKRLISVYFLLFFPKYYKNVTNSLHFINKYCNASNLCLKYL